MNNSHLAAWFCWIFIHFHCQMVIIRKVENYRFDHARKPFFTLIAIITDTKQASKRDDKNKIKDCSSNQKPTHILWLDSFIKPSICNYFLWDKCNLDTKLKSCWNSNFERKQCNSLHL